MFDPIKFSIGELFKNLSLYSTLSSAALVLGFMFP